MIPGRPARGRFAAPGPGEGRLNAPSPSPVWLPKMVLRVGRSGQSRGGKITPVPPGRVGEAAHTRIPAKTLRIRNKYGRQCLKRPPSTTKRTDQMQYQHTTSAGPRARDTWEMDESPVRMNGKRGYIWLAIVGLLIPKGWWNAEIEVSDHMQRSYRQLLNDYLMVRLFGRLGQRHHVFRMCDGSMVCGSGSN